MMILLLVLVLVLGSICWQLRATTTSIQLQPGQAPSHSLHPLGGPILTGKEKYILTPLTGRQAREGTSAVVAPEP